MANTVAIDVKVTGGQSLSELSKSFKALGPAILPVAASLAPLAAGAAGAAVAVGVLGAAVAPQIKSMGEAASAEKKYSEAVDAHGKTSKEASAANVAYLQSMAKLPPETRKAAVAFSLLSDDFTKWSDSLASDTMPAFTKSFAVFSTLLPRTVPMVKDTAVQMDRLVTAAGGAVAVNDGLIESFGRFASGALKKTVDGVMHLSRLLSEGDAHGPITQFMDYARAQGPAVNETLRHLGDTLMNVLEASMNVSGGMLDIVNALAKLAASVPSGLISSLLQLYVTFKLVRFAALGFVALSGAFVAAGTAIGDVIVAMGVAAVSGAGALTALKAGFASLSKVAKSTVIIAALLAIGVGIAKLDAIGRAAPPNIDKLTTSLGRLGMVGRSTGESARLFGKNLEGLHNALSAVADPSFVDNLQQTLVKIFTVTFKDSTPVKEAKDRIRALDEALTALATGGKADEAAVAFERLKAAWVEGGGDVDKFVGQMDGYTSALADAKFEQDLAAQSMGIFGSQAIAVQQKLDKNAKSVDGLKQSLNALNTAVLESRGSMRAMEEAIDAAHDALKENGKTLDDNTEAGRNNNAALDAIASATMRATEAKYQETGSWVEAMKVWRRGRTQLERNAEGMAGNRAEAKKLADQILRTPDKTAMLRGNLEDLQRKLTDAKARLKRVPDSRKAKIRAEISQLTAAVARAKAKLSELHNRTITIRTNRVEVLTTLQKKVSEYYTPKATGGIIGAQGGGPRSRLTLVGEHGPELADLPTGTMIKSNPDTQRILAGGSGGQPMIIQQTITLDGRVLATQLFNPLQGEIRKRGGDPSVLTTRKVTP